MECVEQQRFRFLEVWLLFCSQILDHCTPGEEGPSADSGLDLLKISGFLKRCVWSFVPNLNHHSPFCTAMCVCRVRLEGRGKIHKSTWTQGDSVSYSGLVYCSSSFSVSFFINAELNLKSLLYWTLLWTCLQLEVAALRCLHGTRIYQLIYTSSSGFSWANPLLSPNKDDMTFFFQVPLPGEVIEISCGLDHMAAIIRLTWISLPFCDVHVDGLSWGNLREKCKEVTNESLQLMLC